MPTYVVKNKAHLRATITEETAQDGHGNTYTVRNAGAPVRFEVGALVTDIRPDELTAFPDRFELIEGDPPILRGTDGAPPPRLNPELFALLRRANAGDATADEQHVVGQLVIYLEHHALGTTTPEETETLEQALKEFDMPLFVEASAF